MRDDKTSGVVQLRDLDRTVAQLITIDTFVWTKDEKGDSSSGSYLT